MFITEMKKFWLNVKLFFHYFFAGMASADAEITSGEKTSATGDGIGIEQKKETNNVFAQLIRGEVTEEVKELRYEMYQADRKSHEYTYSGGGRAKKNNIFSYGGSIDEEDGNEIQIVQENDTISLSLTDYGIISYGEHVAYDDTKDNDPDKLHDGEKRIHIRYWDVPRFKIENFAKKIVVKKTDEPEKRILDLYFWDRPNQFERISRIFVNYMEKIYNREVRPDIFDFEGLGFISYRAYGTDATKMYGYSNIQYRGIKKFDGNYVVSLMADVVEDGTDLLDDIYHESTAKKIANNEARENASINLIDAAEAIKGPSVTKEEAEEIFSEVENNEK